MWVASVVRDMLRVLSPTHNREPCATILSVTNRPVFSSQTLPGVNALMRLREASTAIDALRNTRPCCLICSRTEHYPHKLSGPEAPPRWKCPQRSGLLTWFALLTMPSAAFFALVAPLLVGETPTGVLVSRTILRPSCVG